MLIGKRSKLRLSAAVSANRRRDTRRSGVTIQPKALVEVAESGSCMGPSSAHEREIARLICEKDHQTRLPLSAVADIAASLDFMPSKEETQFLVRYFLWWRDRCVLF